MKINNHTRQSTHILLMVGFSIFLLATVAFAVLEDQGTTVKRDSDGCTVHVILQIGVVDINDPDPNMVDYVRGALKACLEGIPCTIQCVRPSPNCEVDVTVDVKEWGDIRPLADTIKYHKVEMVDPVPDSFSWAFRGVPNSINYRDRDGIVINPRPNLAGKWARMKTGAPIEAFVWVHEALHLAGLDDEYCEDRFLPLLVKIFDIIFFKIEWRSCPPSGGPHPCLAGLPDEPPPIRATRPCTGHENDIMGDHTQPASDSTILKIVALAGPALNSCPEHPCCPGPCDTPPERIWGGLPPSYYCWGNPSRYGDRFLNERFDIPPDLRGRLDKIEIAFKLTGSTGTPDPDFYVWLSDGLYPLDDNPPSQAIGHFHIPYESILWDTSYTVVETWEQGIVFNPGEKFHIGYAHAYTPGDSLLVLSDDGANNSNRSVEWHVTPDTGWGTILDDWDYGVDFFINAMICPYPPYVCGDCNGDSVINATDVVYLINYLFIRGPSPDPLCIADVNHDGQVNAADVVYLINYLFIHGPAPSPDCCSGKKIEKDSPQIRSAPGKLPKSPGDLERIK